MPRDPFTNYDAWLQTDPALDADNHDEEDTQMPLTSEQQQQLDQAYNHAKAENQKSREKHTANITTLDGMNIPEGDFDWTDTEAGDWHAYSCGERDCPQQWHLIAYTFGIKREDGILTIELNSCDEDGNWDLDELYESDTGTEDDLRQILKTEQAQLYDYFDGWNEYWYYATRTGTDPLNQFFNQPTPEAFFKECMKQFTPTLKEQI